MRLYYQNESFDPDEVVSGKIKQKNLSSHAQQVINYLKEWLSDQSEFSFQSSGSTGKPQKIILSRDQLAYSAISTLDFLFGKQRIHNALLCLNPTYVGGRQMIYRSAIRDLNLIIEEPSSNPLKNLKEHIDLLSLVPYQISEILEKNPEKFNLVDCVLIGGAHLSSYIAKDLTKFKRTRFYQTFGMTETASHIALKKVGTRFYTLIGDTQIEVDDRSCLRIKGSVTNEEWVQTNDVVRIKENTFEWFGRADFVINSGGVKLHPETIEGRISDHFTSGAFAITAKMDEKLGEKAVLVSTTKLLSQIKSSAILPKYEVPREELLVKDLPLLPSGKIDRIELKKMVNSD